MSIKNNPSVIRSWAFYDWANSVYPLVITTAIFPIYYSEVTSSGGSGPDWVEFFGRRFINTELYSYVLSASFLLVSIISPFLSGIADYTGSKKRFLKFFCYLGATGCALLYFFDPGRLELSMLYIFMASVGFWGSLVFYNAFLPEIAEPEHHDRVSAMGYAYGYAGSSILLIIILAIIMFLDTTPEKVSTKYMFLLVALWWAGFAQITYRGLPDNVYGRKPDEQYIWKGYQELRKVWYELGSQVNLKRFLRAFFMYSMGVQTVMVMAVLFAKKEIDWGGQGNTGLIISVLIIQFIAIAGAYMFAKLSEKIGNLPVLSIALVIWMGICLVAYFIHHPWQFYVLAAIVGLVMGGIQSLSRSTYSKMLPETIDHASYFSFYDAVEKIGFVIGAFLFGLIEGITNSMRYSALALFGFFIVAFFLLRFVKPTKSIKPLKAQP
ncbi:MAG: MFS transporter [Salibacteraceae bacterium]